jgi:hypothetical protein
MEREHLVNIANLSAVISSVVLVGGAAAQGTAVGAVGDSGGRNFASVQKVGPGGAALPGDSIALERTACLGTCPAYRVSITRAGDVHFVSRNYGEPAWGGEGHVDSSGFRDLMVTALFGRFTALPDTIETERKYCPTRPTDQPRAIVTIYYRDATKTVVDYQGCMWAPVMLRRFEEAIDKTAGSAQWSRPNTAR